MATTTITMREASSVLREVGEEPCSTDMRAALDEWTVTMLREHVRPARGRTCPTAWQVKTEAAAQLGYDSPNLVPFRLWGAFVAATASNLRTLAATSHNPC